MLQKIIDKTWKTDVELHMLKSEVQYLEVLHHPNLVRFHSVYKNEENLTIVTEYIEGCTLTKHLISNPNLREGKVKSISHQILQVVQYNYNC